MPALSREFTRPRYSWRVMKRFLPVPMRSTFRHCVLFVCAALLPAMMAFGQPTPTPAGITFTFDHGDAGTVSLIGDFNSWSPTANPMSKDASGTWVATTRILPGTYQYGFLVDGQKIVADPKAPFSFQDFETASMHSLLTLGENGKIVTEGYPARRPLNDRYEKKGGTVYLNLVWRHTIPMFYDRVTDQIPVPFARMKATRDYFEMYDVIQRYPNIHATTVVSPTLLFQIQEIYVKRMEPFVKKYKSPKPRKADIDANGFLARMKGKTDPWIDIALTPAERLTDTDKGYLYKNEINAFTMPYERIQRFPDLLRLHDKYLAAKGNPEYTVDELRTLKFFAILANFDTEFFERAVVLLQTGTRIKLSLDLRDIIYYRSDEKYYLKRTITEDDCRRIVASAYHIMSSILPTIVKTQYNRKARVGQVEIAGTSYSDALLPLLANNKVARDADPNVTLPNTLAMPADVTTQLDAARVLYGHYFKEQPTVYVPAYGAISEDLLPILKKSGYQWFVSDEQVLSKSNSDLTHSAPYRMSVEGMDMGASFGDALSQHRLDYVYRNYYAENAADDLVRHILSLAPADGKKDALVTIVLNNDDHFMHYRRDTDGKGLANSLYRKINALFDSRAIISTTISEFVDGNMDRGIPSHPVAKFEALGTLAAGSSMEGDFDAWLGTPQSNAAWNMWIEARTKVQTPYAAPAVDAELDPLGFVKQPLLSLYEALDNEWFMQFRGTATYPKSLPTMEERFTSLVNAGLTGAGATPLAVRSFSKGVNLPTWDVPKRKTKVFFTCKLVDREAITHVFIAGNRRELANAEPNTVKMFDNGENGDEVYGNNIWTLIIDLDEGPLKYKFTNSGGQGTWDGSEDFPSVWREVNISGESMRIDDVFGKIKKNN